MTSWDKADSYPEVIENPGRFRREPALFNGKGDSKNTGAPGSRSDCFKSLQARRSRAGFRHAGISPSRKTAALSGLYPQTKFPMTITVRSGAHQKLRASVVRRYHGRDIGPDQEAAASQTNIGRPIPGP